MRSLKFVNQFQFLDSLPAALQPASVRRAADQRMQITGLGEFADEVPLPAYPTTVEDALLLRADGDQWAVDVRDSNDNGLSVAKAILQGTA